MRLEAEVHPHPSLTHLGYLLTGLEALARSGRLELTAVRGDPASHPLVLRCRVDDGRGPERRVVFDMLDRTSEWDLPALDGAHLYFKRSFHRPDVERLGPERAGRVEPFGMNFLCRSGTSTRWVLRHAVLPELLGLTRGACPRLAHRWVEYRSFFGSPGLEAFEVPPEAPAAPRIAFQTRVWTRGELGPESESLNEERVATVRALRRAFGQRFCGGLVPTPLARARWPGEISDAPTARREHIRWVHGALVAVYTRGLHHSTAFKLPEYLAASRCVVGEPVRNALPRPLVPGEHLLEFQTPEECVARCAAALESRDTQERLRRAAWEYWRSEGRPEVRVERCLARALGGSETCPPHAALCRARPGGRLRRAGPR
ncbi:MAG TPA: glycosyltransferase [Myxococcaceae bacterium]|nr:glycosyltransferase [Myxococcaceae bacterium]